MGKIAPLRPTRRCLALPANGIAECVTCGSRKPWKELQAGHFIPKARGGSVYFLEENIHVQCDVCNRWNGGRLIEYTRFMQETYGPEMVDRLLIVSREIVRRKLLDYQALEIEYREKYEALGVTD